MIYLCKFRGCERFTDCPLDHRLTVIEHSDPDETTGEPLYFAVCDEVNHTVHALTRHDLIEGNPNGPAEATQKTSSPVTIGKGFPFITYCDPNAEELRMNIKGKNGLEHNYAMKICGKERWHYVLQFVHANKNRITLKPYKKGMPIDLSLVFRDNKGYDHRTFYLFTRTTKGSKAKYWLEQTRLNAKLKTES